MFHLGWMIQAVIFSNISLIYYAHAQSCPNPPDTNEPCIPIENWNKFVDVALSSGTERVILCPFSIQKVTSDPLIILKPVTLLCREEAACVIQQESGGQGILKIKGGLTKVTLSGFVFQSSGTIGSAVHVTFGTAMKQMFCGCFFNGNQGQIRGTALRSEPNTDVDLVNCIFQNNASSDIGVIFNRGTMMIKNCRFKNNSGSAIGSSTRSMTTLSNNLFADNTNGAPLFFHVDNYVDQGGNVARNNSNCDGVYVDSGSKCISFEQVSFKPVPTLAPQVSKSSDAPSPSPVTSATSAHVTLNIKEAHSCEKNVTVSTPCIRITDFVEFKQRVEQATGTLIFCPFTISQGPEKLVYVTTNVQIVCKESRMCRIVGPGGQISVLGTTSQVFIQGFVFERSTAAAVHIMSSATQPQVLCNCHFLKNHGQDRGIGLLTERDTNVEVSFCMFEDNKSSDLGGAIFSRGSMIISNSVFQQNSGRGGAIGIAPSAPMLLSNNIFRQNIDGNSIFFHDSSYTDNGGNVAEGNDACNGMYIDRGGKICIVFSQLSDLVTAPHPSPLHPPTPSLPMTSMTAPRGGIGYFNYDANDGVYGPSSGWGGVRDNAEHLRYKELSSTLKRSLVNKCDWVNVNQSPIDLCDNKINNDCGEHHQTRTHSGNINLGDQQVIAQILPSKLRLKYYPDRPPADGPYPPEADFANNWNGFAEVNHIDIKIPSEHTICGMVYPAEYSIYMVHPLRQQTIVVSILLALHPNDNDNKHLQKVINEWQSIYDDNENRCKVSKKRNIRNLKNRRSRKPKDLVGSVIEHSSLWWIKSNATMHLPVNISKGVRRELIDESPFGRGGWDPFHRDLERTIYFWGYWGSLTEPPCSTFVAWRVLTEPAYISRRQLEQMKTILFSNRNELCEYTSVNYQQSVARPIQPNRGRLLHKCTINDYVSDKEKEEMRKKTGNLNWCC